MPRGGVWYVRRCPPTPLRFQVVFWVAPPDSAEPVSVLTVSICSLVAAVLCFLLYLGILIFYSKFNIYRSMILSESL